jgi:aldehyde dehydrogenase (NAD+)
METIKNLIAGEWIDSSQGDLLEDRNPARQADLLAIFPSATSENARRAVETASAASSGWASMPWPKRGAILHRTSQIIDRQLDEFAKVITREEGKTLAEARAEAERTRDIFLYFSGDGWRNAGDVLPGANEGQLIFTRREPLGVISVITPWNVPAAIPAWKIAPALVYGNAVGFKPSSLTPLIGMMLVRTLIEAGLPPNVISFVTGSGPVVGEELVTSPYVAGVTFTGSYEVGSRILAQARAAKKRIQCEMGGKNPLVVLRDADLDLAVELTVKGGFGLTGQACTATSRVIVDVAIADSFVERLANAAKSIVVGDGLDPKTEMGPVVSQDQLETDMHYVQIASAEGGRLVAGGQLVTEGSLFFEPTIFDHVAPGMRIAQEEVFGPVIAVIRSRDFDEAIEIANGVQFGLSAGVVTNNLHQAFKFADAINAGVVKINEPTTGVVPNAPFGGFRNSSANTFKEQGTAAAEYYTRTKTIYLNHRSN